MRLPEKKKPEHVMLLDGQPQLIIQSRQTMAFAKKYVKHHPQQQYRLEAKKKDL